MSNPSIATHTDNSDPLLQDLNEVQREAVAAPPGNMLVLAGAGSGKTRVLVHRVAWLIERQSYFPQEILAVTFTNKAATEMRTRIGNLLDMPVGTMWVGTFHGLAHRLLRIHWREAGLPSNFQVIDSADQLRLIKRLMKQENIDEKSIGAKEVAGFINRQKEEGQRARHVVEQESWQQKIYLDLYRKYEKLTMEGGLVDFAEMLLRSHELWLDDKELLERYRRRFRYLLVDEFQDTNGIQFAWIRLLAGNDNHVMAVGDDDQSIYSWRGARLENILQFQTEYADAKVLRLEQNYRSTQTILDAANKLIQNNATRLDKTLWTQAGRGEPIRIFNAYSEFEEARFVADKCKQWQDEGTFEASEIAILYRNNAQSRVLEQIFSEYKIPYRIHGGTRFYERAEIRNAIAYMTLMLDPHSDVAVERVINMPPRGIGAKTMEDLRSLAQSKSCSLWQAAKDCIAEEGLTARARGSLQNLVDLVRGMSEAAEGKPLKDVATHAVYDSKLWDHYGKEKGESGRTRQENMEELIVAAEQFTGSTVLPLNSEGQPAKTDNRELLRDFLDLALLDSGEYQAEGLDAVQLMTLHAAKGLEFPVVFITGLEEDLFPHSSAVKSRSAEEEERRLAYVGITRSMRILYLSHASSRTLFRSQTTFRLPSRFLDEIRDANIEHVRKTQARQRRSHSRRESRSWQRSSPSERFNSRPTRHHDQGQAEDVPWKVGQFVEHGIFGEGTIVSIRGKSDSLQLEIQFSTAGRKWIVANTPQLT